MIPDNVDAMKVFLADMGKFGILAKKGQKSEQTYDVEDSSEPHIYPSWYNSCHRIKNMKIS